MTYEATKRALDCCGALLGLLLPSPILMLVALAVRIRMGSPVFFRQERAGKDAVPFRLWKFRSMTDERDENGELLADADRLTRLGQFLRSTSLDEFPSFLNVLRGEMSLVGPRPLPMKYVPRYSADQRRRLDVLPGVTGWAQVNGRNAVSWKRRLEMDAWYVDHRNLKLDIYILGLTVTKVLRRSDISAHGEATMPEFTGKE